MKTIIHSVRIEATPQEVYCALTTEAGLSAWWTTKVTVEPGEGGVIRFTFHGDFHPHMLQNSLHPARFVEWRCVDGHPNWRDDTFTFSLREQGEETSLQFVQRYSQELDDDTYGTYNFKWGYYLNSLKRFCEEETGAPFEVPN